MQSPPVTGVRSPRRRALSVVLMAVLVLGALSGCARVRTALALQPDDTVTGEVVIATPQKTPDDRGPTLTLPEDLRSEVDVSDYRQDGYAGSVLRFSGLSFDQVAQLTSVAGAAGEQRTQLTLRRAGNRVLVSGKVDLTTIPVDRADFQLKISAPGEVLDTNGDTDSGTISWNFTPGEVGDIRASLAYDDPNAPSATAWTLGLALLVAAVSVGVVALARRDRNEPLTPAGR